MAVVAATAAAAAAAAFGVLGAAGGASAAGGCGGGSGACCMRVCNDEDNCCFRCAVVDIGQSLLQSFTVSGRNSRARMPESTYTVVLSGNLCLRHKTSKDTSEKVLTSLAKLYLQRQAEARLRPAWV